MKANLLIYKVVQVVLVLFCFSCNKNVVDSGQAEEPVSRVEAEYDFEVIAYYTRSTGKIDASTIQQLDQIIYSFLHLKGTEFKVEANDSVSIAYLVSLKKVNPDLKILLSLGGWGGCETCSDVFSTEEGRVEFAKSVKDVFERFNTDGIDLDWEYPAVAGYAGHPYKPEDRENFTYLVKELRERLGDGYEISFAAGGFEQFLEQSIEWGKVMPLLDRVNLMSYDLVNGGSPQTGHHTPLYSTTEQALSANKAIQFLESAGVPAEKIVIGAAFYARVWEGVENASNGLYQPGKFKEALLYKDLDAFFKKHPGFENYWDSAAHAPFSYNAEKGLFATYDDSLSIARKTNYVVDKGLGGIMFWQLSGDRAENGLVDVIDRIKKQVRE